MISFKRVKNSDLDDIILVKDQVLYEESTGYLYADFLNSDETLVRKVIMAPSAAADSTYDNTESGLDAETLQDAIDELSETFNVIEFTVDEDTGDLMYTTGNATVEPNSSWVKL